MADRISTQAAYGNQNQTEYTVTLTGQELYLLLVCLSHLDRDYKWTDKRSDSQEAIYSGVMGKIRATNFL